jgi:predicted HTH domain antitoxin
MSSVVDEGIKILIHSRLYSSKDELLEDAFRNMMETRPEIRLNVALELYRNKNISLGRGAEIAKIPIEEFKRILKDRGISIITEAPSREKLDSEVRAILGE